VRLIRAFKLIASRVPHKLVLQGRLDSTYTSELKTLVRDLNIEERVVFLGYVLLYSSATVFATLSLYEGFGLTPLEAMACGTPVVASNGSSLPEVVGDAGILVDPSDIRQISEGLLRVIEHPQLRAELSEKAIRRAAMFNWASRRARICDEQ
jgi:glycosyltransferase involved in cell wall biosynthesis